jgi:expansin (peptidoglycan-binding protein)
VRLLSNIGRESGLFMVTNVQWRIAAVTAALLAVGGGAVALGPGASLAASSGAPATTVAVQAKTADEAPLARRIKPGKTYTGMATFYDANGAAGACSYDAGTEVMTAAMNTYDYDTANACGDYVKVTGVKNGKSIIVRITNLCPGSCRLHQLDLNPLAFDKLDDRHAGETPITWKLLSRKKAAAGISLRYKVGSSQWWCGIQVIDHRNPVARVSVTYQGKWRRLKRTEYNYFLSPEGHGCGKKIKVTDIYGQTITIRALKILPDVTQATKKQFKRH